MKKALIILATVLAFNLSNAQEIVKTEQPIFKSANLKIENLGGDKVLFLFRNNEYIHTVEYKSITFKSKGDVLSFFNKIAELLESPKTSEDEDLRVNYDGFYIVRYGFAQKAIFLLEGSDGYAKLTKGIINKVVKELNK